LVLITASADARYNALIDHYLDLERVEAAERLEGAFNAAVARIEADPLLEPALRRALPHPRPYPSMERHGFLWIHEHIYWFGYATRGPDRIITNVMWDRSQMPENVSEDEEPIGPA
jgi:plasmid stabilization system protein ParE